MRKILIILLALGFMAATSPMQAQETQAQGGAAAPIVRQKPSAVSPAGRTTTAKAKAGTHKADAPKAAALIPLTERERALQLLDRFTFGPRPGDLDRVLAMGTGKWFEQQLNPDAIKDPALDRRLADFPTLSMTPEQALTVFPDRGTIQQVADGKRPMPTDPLLAAMYEVQVAKLRKEQAARKVDGNGDLPPEASDAEKAADKQEGQIVAARVAGELFAMPKNQRMATLIAMPVEDRIAFTGNVAGDQKNHAAGGLDAARA